MKLRLLINKIVKLLININFEKRELVIMTKIVNKQEAIKKAREVYNQLFDEDSAILFDEYATDLNRVLKHFELKAYMVDMQENFSHIPEFSAADVSGFLLKTGKDSKIYVDKNQAPYRRRFSIAHEIGHFALNHLETKELDILFRDDLSSNGSCPEEIAANAFAAELLMPENLIKYIYNENNSVLKTAIAFAVSEQAVRFRLKNLGVL